MPQIKVRVKKLRSDAKLPVRSTPGSAGYDVFACIDEPVTVVPNDSKMIGTGLSMALPDNIFAGIYARSGMACKKHLRPSNCVGVCDSDYRGEYMVSVHNDGTMKRVIEPGDKIAQIIFHEYNEADFDEVEELDSTERGADGFGSSGDK